MSYILDALRRADAERQQGQVPGLHANAHPLEAASVPRSRLPLWSGLIAALLVLMGGAAWWWFRPAAAPAPVVMAAAVAPPLNPAAAAAMPMPMPMPIVVSSPPPAAVTPQPSPLTAPALAIKAPAAAMATAPKPTPLSQLSPEQRRELPPLLVGGSVWSDNAASRFVILDGQVVHEGDTLAAGLVLERLLPKSAVLRWRDTRLEISL